MQPSLPSRHKHIDARALQAPAMIFSAPADLKHAAITAIFVRASHKGMYVGVNFKAEKVTNLQERLKKHNIRTGKNVAAALQYSTKNVERQRELVKIAKHDRVISEVQANSILQLIAGK